MASIVLELQRDALDSKVSVPDLLRKALVVSRKLGLDEFGIWINYELNGYPADNMKIPAYRHLRGEVKAWNPFHGWQPVFFGAKDAERISTRACTQSVAEIQNLLEDREGSLAMPFNPETERVIQKAIGEDLRVLAFVSPAALAGILDTARTTVLNWTLELEQKGVLGEGLSFSEKERTAAAQVPSITNLFVGPVQSPQIQQASPQAVQIALAPQIDLDQLRNFLASLKESSDQLRLSSQQAAELSADTATIESQVASPSPKSSILRECLQSIRRLLEGAAGSAAGQLLLTQIGRLLG